MMDKIVRSLTGWKAILGLIGLIYVGAVYGYESLHKSYVKRNQLKLMLEERSINDQIDYALSTIIELRINQGFATKRQERHRYESLIKVRQSQIVALRQTLTRVQ